ncbi:MAG: hypothetical protein BWX87_02489 [Bacteroidetes bacterium ADurb.Bin123]|nr:MAG: hypothetical protein BWX87_02489 [Bacteroidetes bacterium ADurb.Bin123]
MGCLNGCGQSYGGSFVIRCNKNCAENLIPEKIIISKPVRCRGISAR